MKFKHKSLPESN